MSNYRISRIYLDNYKLFVQRELIFTDCSLAVFDGPNGYGKTSAFDAIELLVTGNIKRVSDNSSILKTEAYETVFIAGNPKKDVIIKGEFISDDKTTLVIAKVIPAASKIKKGKKNNPTKLGELTNTYILPSYETNDYDDIYKCDHADVISKFGNDVISFFDLFYYIKQEDRLDFLKKTEKDRMAGINRLFNMQKEKKDLDNANKVIRQFNKLLKDLEGIISSKETEIKGIENTLQNNTNSDVKYEKLLFWKKETEIWDEQVILINDTNKKDEIINNIKGIQLFIQNYNEFSIEQKNNWCSSWLDKQNLFRYYMILYLFKDDIDNTKATLASLKFLKQQVQLFSDANYLSINFAKVAETLKISANIQLINEIVSQIANYDKSSNSLAKAASELNQAREILNTKSLAFAETQSTDGRCSFCGYDWGSSNELAKHISRTSESFKNFSDESTLQKDSKIAELKNIYVDLFLPEINKYFEKHKILDNDQFEYIFNPKNKVEETFNSFVEGCTKYNINIEKYMVERNSLTASENIVQEFVSELSTSIKPLTNEYIAARSTNDFYKIFNSYFNENTYNINITTLEKVQNKVAYIEYNYYNTTFEKIEQLRKELSKNVGVKNILSEEIIPETIQYKEVLKNSIEKYQNQVIKNIEIPFYIYSGRIMQSYQGGLGILIKESDNSSETENESGLNSIRFICPSRPAHDIMYTLSSGQLSTVIISFTLALNKIYSNDKFKCIFIDDPVQTMDELNIASFVELMRNEFQDRQIILSTHEDTFSRYVRYKYSKYGLKANSIALKSN
ncbi:AAA family ATPase [Clostridium sp. FP2]|uniref:AAA family ATPase n=1 Tax=Clostridium sp. FP2 TaxID=2724481 RepID=UPI0013E952B4|nr:AAA family ATPase [Clostridium sp. FP2]MBZ9622143.1 AAA family ATPase [Clostridium sp. FP2]